MRDAPGALPPWYCTSWLPSSGVRSGPPLLTLLSSRAALRFSFLRPAPRP